MKIGKFIIVLSSLFISLLLLAAVEQLPSQTQQEERNARRYKRNGGKVEDRSKMKGSFSIINCQSILDISNGDRCASEYSELFLSDFRYVPKCDPITIQLAPTKLDELKTNAGVYIVNDKTLPALLVAPEERWAFVNVAKLCTKDCSAERLKVRTERELSRAVGMICGTDCIATGSNSKPILSPSDLEYRMTDGLTVDAIIKIADYLPKIGILPFKRASYKTACLEGWAPAPTDTVQKVIWDEVHKIPQNPMKIEFDPKKGR